MNRGLLCSSTSLHPRAFSDCDWAGYVNDRFFTIRICIFLLSLISWKGKKQIVISCSSAKAEYRALASCTVEIVWLQWVTIDMGIHLTQRHYYVMIKRVLFKLLATMSYMSLPNILKLSVILYIDIFSLAQLSWFLFLLQVSLLICSPKSLTHLSDSTLLLTISQCFLFCITRLREGELWETII